MRRLCSLLRALRDDPPFAQAIGGSSLFFAPCSVPCSLPETTNRLAFGYPRCEGGQPLGCDWDSCGNLCPACRTVIKGTGTDCSSNRWIVPVLCSGTRQRKGGFPKCHCHLPTGQLVPFEGPFKKRFRASSILAELPLAAVAQGGPPSRSPLSRSSPGRCCR